VLRAFATGLAYFGTVARLRSVRGAAESLRIAPSALSRQIRNIEERLDVTLFERGPHGVHLTAAGKVLLTYLERWETDFDGLSEALHGLAGLRLGTLRLATVEAVTFHPLPQAIGALRAEMPGITVHVTVGLTDAVLLDVAEGKAELGVLINLPKASGVRSAWEIRNAMGAVMRPDHPLAGRREITIAECLAYPLVMPDERLVAYSAVRRALGRTRRAPRVSATCNRIGPLKSLVKAGVGLAFMAQIDIGPDVAAGDLRFIRLTDRDIESPLISAVAPKRTNVSPAGKRFLELLQHEVMMDRHAPAARALGSRS